MTKEEIIREPKFVSGSVWIGPSNSIIYKVIKVVRVKEGVYKISLEMINIREGNTTRPRLRQRMDVPLEAFKDMQIEEV